MACSGRGRTLFSAAPGTGVGPSFETRYEAGDGMSQETGCVSVKIGLCQTETVEWDVEGNFRRVLADITAAAGQGAELIITPECVLNGYAGPGLTDWKERFPVTTEPLHGSYLSQVRERVKALQVEVVFGFAERGETGRFTTRPF
jgi:predicted amidohydrolase